jgi:glycosyltransferase involved in cell wall biosynthesis
VTPWLSVIIPVYNGERYLATALDSIQAQHDDQIELIAVDDGSSDASVDILRSHEQRLPLQIHCLSRSGNWVANTNIGLTLARGTYVSMLHQDDMWLPGRLDRVKQIIDEGGRPELVLHQARFINAAGMCIGTWRCPLPRNIALDGDRVLERLLIQNFIALPTATFKREAAADVGGLDEDLWYTADWDLWLKIAACGFTRYLPETLASYRVHDQAQTTTRSAQGDGFRKQLEIVLDRHLSGWKEQHGDEVQADQVESVARFSLEVNVALAAFLHERRGQAAGLAARFMALGPAGWRRYFRDSRVEERLGSRIRAKLRS